MQRILSARWKERLSSATRTSFVECFNNKIKTVFLILMWTLIWQTVECTPNSKQAMHNNNNNNTNMYNLYEQLEINNTRIVDNKVVKRLYPALADVEVENARQQKNEAAAGAAGADTKWNPFKDKQMMTLMEADQYATINETLKTDNLKMEIGERRKWSGIQRFKRDEKQMRKGQEQRELRVAAYAMEPLSEDSKQLEIQTTATTTNKATIKNTTGYTQATYGTTNSMVTQAINTDTKINEHQNERNNANENLKGRMVVDSGNAVKVATTTTMHTKIPAKTATVPLIAPPNSGDQQAITSEQTIRNNIQNMPHTAESESESQQQTTKEKAKVNTPSMATDETASMQRQLIYEFAIKYKHIPRVTFFTCRRPARRTTNNFAEQEMTNLNMQNINVLRGAQSTTDSSGKTRSTGGVASGKLTVDKVTTNGTIAMATKMTGATKAADSYVRKVRYDGNINSRHGHTSATTDALTGDVTLRDSKSALNSGGTGNVVHKAAIDTSTNINAATTAADASVWNILIKVVHIDQLINKRPTAAKSKYNNNNGYNKNKYNLYAQHSTLGGIRDFRFSGHVRSADAASATSSTRNAYLNSNWLTQVLRDDGNRQVVVLNLACGVASRRILEMASNKALFNSTYHWLLIEDYTFNRQTGNDDNDVGHNTNNNNKCGNVTNELENNELDSNNNNNIKNNNSNEADSLTDKFQQQKQPQKLQQQQKHTTSEPTLPVRLVSSTAFGTKTNAGNTINMNVTFTNNEDDNMEIIEKYLEKLNININTELILAKRRRRRDVTKVNKVCAAADDEPLKYSDDYTESVPYSESATNNTLQRTDYYQLYDVWSPGQQYGGELNISEIGYFALDDGLQIALWYRRSTTITRRMDMKMARIRCLIVITNKNLTDTLEHYLTTRYDTHLDSMHRFNFALLSHVRDMYNFSFILSKTSTWGYLKNGKFDGMIGALVRKQADIGGSPIFFRIERAKVIDYTTRTWAARPCFIFRHPRSTKKDRIVFLQPFSNTIWILLAFCGIFTICFLWLLTTMERRFEAVGVVKQLGQSTRALNSINAVAATKQQSAIGGNDELRVSCFSTRTTLRQTMRTSGGNIMHCNLNKKKNIFDGQTKEQRKQKLGKLLKHNKVVEQEKVKSISFRHCMLGCGNACCGQTSGTSVVQQQQQQQRFSLLFESMLFYVSSICQQGLTFSTNFFSGRCIVITSLLFAFAIYQFYSASIVGTLLMEKPKTIRTLRDLIHSSLEVGIEDIPYNRDYFLRTKDPVAIELYAKKVTSVPSSSDIPTDPTGENTTMQATTAIPGAEKAKIYRDILHSHEMGAHAKTNQASNWYDPEYGVNKVRRGKFAFHVDVATAYKIIADKFTEKEICDLTEIQLFPTQKMVNIVQKGSPLRKMITYGLRRLTETGLTDYQRKVWHSPKPRCIKQIHTDDLRVDLQTFASALFILIFGYAASLLALSIEIIQHKLWLRYHDEEDEDEHATEEYQK